MPDGRLLHLRDTYPIETAWAPQCVGDELRQVRAAAWHVRLARPPGRPPRRRRRQRRARPASTGSTHFAERLAYSVDETVRLTGLSRDLLYNEMRRGNLPYVKVGRRRLITHQHLQQFLGVAS
jgi:excisionase family DNA binding protein